jgi:hypothetical protein
MTAPASPSVLLEGYVLRGCCVRACQPLAARRHSLP